MHLWIFFDYNEGQTPLTIVQIYGFVWSLQLPNIFEIEGVLKRSSFVLVFKSSNS